MILLSYILLFYIMKLYDFFIYVFPQELEKSKRWS